MTWVHDQIYAAGGQHIPSKWADFADQTGVSAVLHLRPDKPADFKGPSPVAFLWMPVADETQAGLPERRLAAEFVAHCVDQGMRILLHSSLGRHRVRWAYVAYRIRSGRSLKGVIAEVEKKPWMAPYHTDRAGWEQFAKSLKAGGPN